MTVAVEIGESFVEAVTGRDFTRLVDLLAEDVRLRLLVPRGPQANSGAAEVVGRFAGWFGEAREVRLLSSTVDHVAERLVLVYRLRLSDVDGSRRVIEQHLFADLAPSGRIAAIDLLCSGFHGE
jgi:hypothetical protein